MIQIFDCATLAMNSNLQARNTVAKVIDDLTGDITYGAGTKINGNSRCRWSCHAVFADEDFAADKRHGLSIVNSGVSFGINVFKIDR
ncbi:MAG: hypothetical protein ACD_39C00821G0001, partial [uncultured bacterium]